MHVRYPDVVGVRMYPETMGVCMYFDIFIMIRAYECILTDYMCMQVLDLHAYARHAIDLQTPAMSGYMHA